MVVSPHQTHQRPGPAVTASIRWSPTAYRLLLLLILRQHLAAAWPLLTASDLGGMDLELLCQFCQRLTPFDGGQCHLGFKGRSVVSSRPLLASLLSVATVRWLDGSQATTYNTVRISGAPLLTNARAIASTRETYLYGPQPLRQIGLGSTCERRETIQTTRVISSLRNGKNSIDLSD